MRYNVTVRAIKTVSDSVLQPLWSRECRTGEGEDALELIPLASRFAPRLPSSSPVFFSILLRARSQAQTALQRLQRDSIAGHRAVIRYSSACPPAGLPPPAWLNLATRRLPVYHSLALIPFSFPCPPLLCRSDALTGHEAATSSPLRGVHGSLGCPGGLVVRCDMIPHMKYRESQHMVDLFSRVNSNPIQ